MGNDVKKVIVSCGTAIATATYVASKIKEIAEENGIKVEITQCKAAEVNYYISMLGKVDLIVTTTPVNVQGIPVVNGVPFLSGVGVEQVKKKIVDILKKS
ncbi:MAG TPA: PTS galactitol transporter subunit IIB [Nitrososphaeria archaeon]|nr:MAG: PTS galactitol transporter subunit IIB [Nitrososphaerota archaeon]HDJ66449.1 PTS galactitol transporter subunit IIB [Nitrososphaeria archaeon]